MNKKVQNQVNVLKEFVVYNYNNGNLGLFLNSFAHRFLALEQLKNKENNEEYKWLVYLFNNMGIKPVLNKGGKITYENINLPKQENKNKSKENIQNENQNKKFFQKKDSNKLNFQNKNKKNFSGFSSVEDLVFWFFS